MKIKKNKLIKHILRFYILAFYLLLAGGSIFIEQKAPAPPPPPPTPVPIIKDPNLAKYIAIGSFIISILAFAFVAFKTDDDKKRLVIGIGGAVFLIVTVVLLLSAK